ncbi:ABC transporter ATP-binding protein [Dethiothermospora halolimnae]|uniref:ABC transporter ATP-binding protein n=1 Tax=Dethiothermospora halolimnae TaxID=3114390 RepID=UPI003CCC39D3
MINIKNITKKYDNVKVLDDFNLSIEENKIICLLGPSGCGKTTLLNILSGLTKYESGNIYGLDNKSFSYIFQEPRLLPTSTVEDNIIFVLKKNYDKKTSKKIADKYVDLVKLKGYKNFYPNQLSGGMKQRVSIARAFAYESQILLMDEPFKGLDIELKRNLMDIFLSLWNENNKTVIFVTHDIDEAILISDTIFVLDGPPIKIKNTFDLKSDKRNRRLDDDEIASRKKGVESSIREG